MTNKAPVILLTGCQTPAAVRRAASRPDRNVAEESQIRGDGAFVRATVEAALDDEITKADTLIEA